MIDKETFRKTENKLTNYFTRDKKINSLRRKIKLVNAEQIVELEEEIRNMEVDNLTIEANLSDMKEESLLILTAKYKYGLSDSKTALRLSIDRSNVSRKRQKIVEYIANSIK